jgi:hypothetical protein
LSEADPAHERVRGVQVSDIEIDLRIGNQPIGGKPDPHAAKTAPPIVKTVYGRDGQLVRFSSIWT